MTAANVNLILGTLTIVAQAATAILLVLILTKRVGALGGFLAKYGMHIAFAVSFASLAGSLTYSDVLGYEPCRFCWFQRMFMYPQVVLLGLAIWWKDLKMIDYSIALSGIGGLISGYHYLLQLGVVPDVPCAAIGSSATCSQRFVFLFGYISIPMMAFAAFAFMIVVLYAQKAALRSRGADQLPEAQ